MARHDDEEPRIYGPFEHGDRFRVHVVTRRGGKRTTTYKSFASRAYADAFIAGARDEAQGCTVTMAIDAYLAAPTKRGREDSTIVTTRTALRMLLAAYLQRPLRSLAGRGEEIYLAAQTYPAGHRHAGQRRAADTHRVWLTRARTFGKWLVKQRWLKANPFADVDPVGKRVYGADKARLSVDESRVLDAWCRAHDHDHGAVLTLGYLILGGRASELISANVSDLDDGGRLFRIRKSKSLAGRRALAIPPELRLLLLAVAGGRDGSAPLFQSGGRRWSRFTARLHVKRVCLAAGVSELYPQALRRTQATLATDAGETALAVARHLGHATGEAPVVTGQSYIGRRSAADASIARSVRVLSGEPMSSDRGNSSETAGSEPEREVG